MLNRSTRLTFPLRALLTSLLAALIAGCGPNPSVEEGHRLYDANGCGSCHGPSGHGDGPVSPGLKVKPRDFRDTGAFRNGTTVSAIAGTLIGSFQGSAMPPFRNLTPQERESLALYVISLRQEAPAVTAHDAWVRRPLPSHSDTAAYLVLENPTTQNRTLVGISSTAASSVEMHRMSMEKSMMRMDPVDRIEIPAGSRTTLKPGGLHLMIFGLKNSLAEGDTLPLKLKLDDGQTISVQAAVRNP